MGRDAAPDGATSQPSHRHTRGSPRCSRDTYLPRSPDAVLLGPGISAPHRRNDHDRTLSVRPNPSVFRAVARREDSSIGAFPLANGRDEAQRSSTEASELHESALLFEPWDLGMHRVARVDAGNRRRAGRSTIVAW